MTSANCWKTVHVCILGLVKDSAYPVEDLNTKLANDYGENFNAPMWDRKTMA